MRDPAPIADLLADVMAALGVARPMEVSQLMVAWEELAGEPWGSRSVPIALQEGELLVEVDDGGTASLLRFQSSDLIRRLQQELGHGLVVTVRIRVGRKPGR